MHNCDNLVAGRWLLLLMGWRTKCFQGILYAHEREGCSLFLFNLSKRFFMSSLSIAFCVFVGVSLMSLVSAVKERKQEKEANRKFTDGTCKMFSLPREVTWHRGGMILADLDARGNSILIFRRRTCRIPRTLAKDGIQAWNISPREAKILIETNCPGRYGEEEE